jgi:hypothetical protein
MLETLLTNKKQDYSEDGNFRVSLIWKVTNLTTWRQEDLAIPSKKISQFYNNGFVTKIKFMLPLMIFCQNNSHW